jgi:YesN/AraC family two-component response regulator
MTKINLLFKDYEKMSPLTYFTTMKIDEAKKLIQKTNLNFSEIALQLGYESVHYFLKTFKKYTGVSPSDFSKKNYFLIIFPTEKQPYF